MHRRRALGGAFALSVIGVMFMVEASRAADGAISVTATRAGMLGPCQVGVMSVAASPLGALIVIAGETVGRVWEATEPVAERQTVLAGRVIYRIERISPPSDLDPGSVGFSPIGLAPAGLNGVTLVKGGALRMDGPDVATATDMQATAWQAGTVDVEMWPARSMRENVDPAEVTAIRLAPGQRFAFGRGEMLVVTVEGAGADHPARAVLQVLARGK